MDKLVARVDKEVLVEMVRLAQKQGLRGAEGEWKDFLDSHDKKFGASLCDPAKRSVDILIAFLQTFNQEGDLKLFGKMIRHRMDHKAILQYTKDNPEQESPQQRLVRLTIEHPLYMQNYSFPSHHEEWVIVPLGSISKAMESTNMIAIDCEMVLCDDGTEAVVKVCAVDQNLEVKLNNFVKPSKAVADYRKDITGISAEDLEGNTSSLADIQKYLRRLLKHGTILIGHSVYRDLQVLKIDHPRVIDTAYIFKCKNLPFGFSPSLNNLCKAVLGSALRKEGEPHNCLHDAEAPMKLVLAKLEHGFDDPIMVEGQNVPECDPSKLLLHRVPIDVSYQELLNMFPATNICIQSDLKVRGQSYSTLAVFEDSETADYTFEGLRGPEHKDNCGRRQKRVMLETSTGKIICINVRKMTVDTPIKEGLSRRRVVQYDTVEQKRQRTCLHPCNHIEEIEKLKQELCQREQEIFNLQKAVAVFTAEQGLFNQK